MEGKMKRALLAFIELAGLLIITFFYDTDILKLRT
jgi:hypothetical protein